MKRVLDPYLCWAGLTRFRYLANRSSEAKWFARPIRIAGYFRNESGERRKLPVAGLTVAEQAVGNVGRFFTATLQPVTKRSLAAVHGIADFVLAEPGMKAVDQSPSTPPADIGPSSATVMKTASLDVDVVVGVIDGRCGFLNKCFCEHSDPRRSRIDFFWDQGSSARAPWTSPSGFAYGRELRRSALSDELAGMNEATASGMARDSFERQRYAAIDHELPADADWSHGTHVLDTVLSDHDARKPGGPPIGVVYVQLPDAALRDTSSRWTAANVLDGIRYVLARAKSTSDVVVNLSLGSFAGPHDGTSMLERAIDALIDEHEGRLTVVVAAGNAGRIFDDASSDPVCCHGKFSLPPLDRSMPDDCRRQFKWNVDPNDTTESFLELWVTASSGETSASKLDVSLSLSEESRRGASASGASAKPGKIGTITAAADAGEIVGAVINATGRFKSPNGHAQMVLVALGHTAGRSPQACSGTWLVEVTNLSDHAVDISARIERRDVPGELTGYRPQYGFVRDQFALTSVDTLGTLANGGKTIVVGAVEVESKTSAFRITDYSSRGDARSNVAKSAADNAPHILALGKRQAAGFLTGSLKELSGTSMAAAQVSAALATLPLGSLSAGGPTNRASKLTALKALAPVRPPLASRARRPVPTSSVVEENGVPVGFVLLPVPPRRPVRESEVRGGGDALYNKRMSNGEVLASRAGRSS